MDSSSQENSREQCFIDDAAKACHTGAAPDKQKEAMRFMEPLAQDLLKCVLAKAPVRTSDASDELAKAKAKLAEHRHCYVSIETQIWVGC